MWEQDSRSSKHKRKTVQKSTTETWGFQVLPSLYSIYQKVVFFCVCIACGLILCTHNVYDFDVLYGQLIRHFC